MSEKYVKSQTTAVTNQFGSSFWDGVECELEIDVVGVASERSLPRLARRQVEVKSRPPGEEGPLKPLDVVPPPQLALDDLDRGLDLFGTWIVGDLDPDQWESVGGILEPYARRHTAVRIAAAVADGVASFQVLDVDGGMSNVSYLQKTTQSEKQTGYGDEFDVPEGQYQASFVDVRTLFGYPCAVP